MLGARAARRSRGASRRRAEFQRWFEAATDRWTGGEHDDEYAETFAAFSDRVTRGAASYGGAVEPSGPRSCSPPAARSSWAAATLLADVDRAAGRLWRRLNPVCVNSGVTKVVTGRRGTTLVTFNEHTPPRRRPDLLTYR